MRWNILMVAVAVAVAVAGCAEADSDAEMATTASGMVARGEVALPDEDVRSIMELDRAFQDAVAAGDWEALREIYASDAVHMPPQDPVVEGADAIVEYFSRQNAAGLAGFHTATDVVSGDDRIGYHRGTWTADGGRKGKFLQVLRRDPEGGWRIVADTFNEG